LFFEEPLMKRYPFWMSLLILILLAACSLPASRQPSGAPASTATLSPDQVSTQINQMLTLMPTITGQVVVGDASPTAALPTVAVEPPASGEAPAPVITATASPVPPTAEAPAAAVPTDTPVSKPTATQQPAAGGIPTVAVTPISPAATQPSGPTVTPAPGDPRSRLGAPTSTDAMDNANTWIWPTGSDKYTIGSFSGGRQSVTALTGTDGWRMANPAGREFSSLYLEATIRTGACSGSDHYGLIFRVPVLTEPDQGYLFGVTCDGRYSLRRWNGEVGLKGEMKWLANWTASSAIVTGANQTNRLGVMMVGSRLLLYANGKLITEIKDTTYASGYFGLFVGSDNTENLTIQVDEMSYWENPRP